MQAAEITEDELMAFQKVVAIMENGLGRIDGDDLIAASFVDDLSPENVADHADIQPTLTPVPKQRQSRRRTCGSGIAHVQIAVMGPDRDELLARGALQLPFLRRCSGPLGPFGIDAQSAGSRRQHLLGGLRQHCWRADRINVSCDVEVSQGASLLLATSCSAEVRCSSYAMLAENWRTVVYFLSPDRGTRMEITNPPAAQSREIVPSSPAMVACSSWVPKPEL